MLVFKPEGKTSRDEGKEETLEWPSKWHWLISRAASLLSASNRTRWTARHPWRKLKIRKVHLGDLVPSLRLYSHDGRGKRDRLSQI